MNKIGKIKNNYRDHMSLRTPGDEFNDHDPRAPTTKDFKFYTMDLSYFSGKLEMYFRYKEIPFDRFEPTAREFEEILCANTGSEQMPQVYDARPHIPVNKRWLRDTSPIIEYIEQDPLIKSTSRAVIPACGVQAFFQRLLEDYADEYLWRPAMFWRWEPEYDRYVMGYRFAWEFARESQSRYYFPLFIRPFFLSLRQWLLSSYGEDCTTPAKKQIVKNQYLELLDIMERILSQQPYLFGNHPTLIDFGFSGPFFRHFASDSTPRKVMQQRAPAVFEWVARLWNCKGSRLSEDTGFPAPSTLPENWNELLKLLPDYLEYSHLNARAYSRGEGSFAWTNKGEVFHVPMVPYRVWCRKELQHHFDASDEDSKIIIESLLRQHHCWDLLWADGVIDIPPECGTEPPFALYPPVHAEPLLYKWDPDRIFNKYLFECVVTGVMVSAISATVGVAGWMLFKSRLMIILSLLLSLFLSFFLLSSK